MPEIKFFINEEVHTGQLRDAGLELLQKDLLVITEYQQRLSEVNPGVSPLPQDILIGLALGRHGLPDGLRERWKKAEQQMTRLLVSTGVLSYPHQVWRNLFRRLQYTQSLPNQEQASGFLNRTRARIGYLQRPEGGFGRLDSLRWSSLVYTENLMLKGAILGGTYFIEPERPNLN
ncbi:hypothetical protein HYW44_02700 [Candidatus Daviesbacteria bacterium]|nr:hypothetical protein [Candidatus Daviesbacteria bacterium]